MMRRGALIGLAVLGMGGLGPRGQAQLLPKYAEPVEGRPVLRPEEQPTAGKGVTPAPGQSASAPAAPSTPGQSAAPPPPDTRDGRITVSFSPTAPVLGRQSDVSVTLRVADRNGTPISDADLQLTSSIGAFQELHALGDGRYNAAFVLPAARYPQVALCSVVDRRHPVLGALFAIPLIGSTRLPIQSSPGLSLQFEVAGRAFGPFAADEAGKVVAELLVPPGVGRARVTAHRKVGEVEKIEGSEQWLELPAPPFVRVKLQALPPLTADGETGTLVQALVVDGFGSPMIGAQVEMSAALGVVTPPAEVGEGLYRARYTPPRLTTGRTDTLIVRLPGAGPEQEERMTVKLEPVAPPPPPPKTLTLPPGEQWVAPPERPLQPVATPAGSGSR